MCKQSSKRRFCCSAAYDIWQFADACLSTIALHTLLAIGIDRWLNIERPLRVRSLRREQLYKPRSLQIYARSRGIAKRLVVLAWLVPIGMWMIAITIQCQLSSSDKVDYTSIFHNAVTLLVNAVSQ